MEIAPPATPPEVSIIIPARNEEVCLADCVQSLVTQTGATFEIIVVDDGSSDRTREIAMSFAGVKVIAPGPLPEGWTGKNNALVAGVKEARGEWLLFTDADTVHLPWSLPRALAEAKENQAELLSYSPEQVVRTFWELATLPVVFAELARQYPPAKVSDPASPIAAANGQYILVRRETYDAVGGHAAIATNLLEDVALAHAVKGTGRKIRFRYAATAVRTRMYRNFRQLREGWTKNLALLFPRPGWLACWIVAWWAFSWITLLLGIASMAAGHWRTSYYVLVWVLLYMRIGRANFGMGTNLVAVGFGPPLFAYLLFRSRKSHANGSVSWKERTYSDVVSRSEAKSVSRPAKAMLASRH